MIQLAEQTWRYTCVVRVCPEQLPQAMFLCSAFGCFTASSWALISFQTAGVLTNQAFHVSLSFTLFCFTIHTWTPKRMDKILSFSESIWSAADMTGVGILSFVRRFRADCGVNAAKELEIAFFFFFLLFNSLCMLLTTFIHDPWFATPLFFPQCCGVYPVTKGDILG